jgi:lysophospholipid acyltransferase (LPLAT)-like uncharacterized protein
MVSETAEHTLDPGNNVQTEDASAKRTERAARRNSIYSWIIYHVSRLVYATMRIHHDYMPRYEATGKGCIYVTWHGRTMIPANYMRNRNYWTLVSLSRDGELQARIFERFGFQIVRGSTGRGGVKGALQLARKLKEGGALAFTPDGPRGPTHKVQLGVILMAQKSGAPIFPIGISASRRVLFKKSWDSYMIPLPFAHAYWLTGDPIEIPADLDDLGRAAYAELLEVAINKMEAKAEALAGYPHYPAEWRQHLPTTEGQ